jgi:hypothetical protein
MARYRMTARRRAALKKAQAASARKRRRMASNRRKPVRRTAGRAFVAGATLGLSDKAHRRAGLTSGYNARVTKKGQYDKRHRIKKNPKRRTAAYAAGAYATAIAATGAAVGVQALAGSRTRRRVARSTSRRAYGS